MSQFRTSGQSRQGETGPQTWSFHESPASRAPGHPHPCPATPESSGGYLSAPATATCPEATLSCKSAGRQHPCPLPGSGTPRPLPCDEAGRPCCPAVDTHQLLGDLCTRPTTPRSPLTWTRAGTAGPRGHKSSCSSGLLGGSLSPLKYFLGGGFGLEDVGFLTKISKDFFSLGGGWSSWFSREGGLSWGAPDNAPGSGPGSWVPGVCVLAPGPDGCCSPLLLGLPPGDPDA